MKFFLSEGTTLLVKDVSEQLAEALGENKKVLFLLPGGSNIPAAIKVIEALPEELKSSLTLGLTDERYGERGHKDSNEQQFKEAGLDLGSYSFLPMLFDLDFQETIRKVDYTYSTAFKESDVIIGYFGMGADGHIAGVLPHTIAVNSGSMAMGYHTETFQRITLCLSSLVRLHKAFVGVFGKEKLDALRKLKDHSETIDDQPASILYKIEEASIYTDNKEVV